MHFKEEGSPAVPPIPFSPVARSSIPFLKAACGLRPHTHRTQPPVDLAECILLPLIGRAVSEDL